ncbi:MAG: methyl-accepting chemotaxis protein [Tumebacillaceae bacterium]
MKKALRWKFKGNPFRKLKLKWNLRTQFILTLMAVMVLPVVAFELITNSVSLNILSIYVVILIALSIVAGNVLVKSLNKPIRLISEAMERVEEGDLTVRVPSGNDQIGQLGQRINATLDALSGLIRTVGEMTEQVAASSQELTASAISTSEAAKEIKDMMQGVALGAEEQLEKVENVTAVMEELNSSFSQVAANSETVSSTANNVIQSSEMGKNLVQSIVHQMNTIHGAVAHSSAAVKSLGEQSASIQGFVTTITDIAAQTNLLALNAAIEAARAGEAGRGFSVVADEVRKLAEQSAKAAGEVSQIVERILNETDNSTDAMREGIRSVEEGLDIVSKAGEVFNNIHYSLAEVATQIQEVSASVNEMTEGTEHSVYAISMISGSASETVEMTFGVMDKTSEQTSTSEEISASSEALAKLAEELNEKVNQFRV